MTAFQEHSFKGETLWGMFYPKGYIVAVFADCAHAHNAQAALEAVEFSDTRTWTGHEVLERHHAFLAQRNVLERVGASMQGNEQVRLDEYMQAAQLNHCFVTTHIPKEQQVNHAYAVLAPHGPYLVRYYASSGTVDLQEQQPIWDEPLPDNAATDTPAQAPSPSTPPRDVTW